MALVRVVLQRVSRASVKVGDNVTGEIGRGFLLLAGFSSEDTPDVLGWVARKIIGLRVFEDDEGRMNRSIEEVGGEILVMSQFTLYGDVRKGRRPSFVGAAPPEIAEPLYRAFVETLRASGPSAVETGEFGAMMDVSLVNDGPVTLLIERSAE